MGRAEINFGGGGYNADENNLSVLHLLLSCSTSIRNNCTF